MKKVMFIGLLVVVTSGIVTIALKWSRAVSANSAEPAIQVRRLLPVGDENVVPVPSPGAQVEFLYELSNVGKTPLTGLKTQLFCQCAVSQPLPETVAAGSSVQFGFRFPPPQAGIRSERVTVTSANSSNPIAVMNARVYADVSVPHVVAAPERIHVQAIRGQPIHHDLLISVIERAGSQNLIQQPQAEPIELIHPTIIDVRETAEYDKKNVRRVYQLQLRLDASAVTNGTGQLRLCEQPFGQLGPLPVKIEVLEPVVLIPSAFDFHPADAASERKQIVNVVARGNVKTGAIRVHAFDRELIDVRKLSNEDSPAQRFEVTSKSSPTELRETEVIFEAGAGEEAKNQLVLHVRLVPE